MPTCVPPARTSPGRRLARLVAHRVGSSHRETTRTHHGACGFARAGRLHPANLQRPSDLHERRISGPTWRTHRPGRSRSSSPSSERIGGFGTCVDVCPWMTQRRTDCSPLAPSASRPASTGSTALVPRCRESAVLSPPMPSAPQTIRPIQSSVGSPISTRGMPGRARLLGRSRLTRVHLANSRPATRAYPTAVASRACTARNPADSSSRSAGLRPLRAESSAR